MRECDCDWDCCVCVFFCHARYASASCANRWKHASASAASADEEEDDDGKDDDDEGAEPPRSGVARLPPRSALADEASAAATRAHSCRCGTGAGVDEEDEEEDEEAAEDDVLRDVLMMFSTSASSMAPCSDADEERAEDDVDGAFSRTDSKVLISSEVRDDDHCDF